MKKIIIALLLFCTVGIGISFATKNSADYKKAKILFQQSLDTDDVKVKAELRKNILQIVPESDIGYFSRAWLLRIDNKNTEALINYTRAIELNPKLFTAYWSRGSIYYELGEYQKSIDDFTKAIKIKPIKPKYAKIYFQRAYVYSFLGKYKNAFKDITRAIKLDPKKPDFYFVRGFLYGEMKKYQKEIADYSMAIKLNPKYADAYYNRGNAYNNLGKFQEARDDYTKAIELNPKNAYAYCNRGLIYKDMNKFEEAIKDFNRAIKLSSPLSNQEDSIAFGNSHNGLGSVYYRENKNNLAIKEYSIAIKTDPNVAAFFRNRGRAYNMKGDKKSAIQDWEKAVEMEPKEIYKKVLEDLKSGRAIPNVVESIEYKTLNYHVQKAEDYN